MTRTDYLQEINRFKATLTELDNAHRQNGNLYTPAEIQNVRKALRLLEQLVEVGLYDVKAPMTVGDIVSMSMDMLDTEDLPKVMNEILKYTGGK